jgi:transcriptional regulator with XRE-family HTH domain
VAGDVVAGELEDIGTRLKEERERVRISQRELARRLGVSASLISQIETGKVQPSVPTLYALVRELGGTFDEIMFGEPMPAADGQVTDVALDAPRPAPRSSILNHPPVPLIQRGHDRKTIQFTSGVRWERLTAESVPGFEFLFVSYEPGAESGPPGNFQRHTGREWCYIVAGTLTIDVGFESFELGQGDAITYDSATPHRLENRGETTVESVWFQLG